MKRTTIFLILTFLYLVAVALLCFANFSHAPHVQRTFLGFPTDKVIHFLMFLPFPILAFFSIHLKKAGLLKTVLLLAALFALGCLIAWGTELVQDLIPYREMELLDFKADRMGLACGCAITFLIQLLFCRKTDA